MIMRFFLSLMALCLVAINALAAGPVRILAIGNSFSEDAIENNFHEICASQDVPVIVGNLYIGGCSIERHYDNIQGEIPDYRYRKIGVDGVMTEQNNVTLQSALVDEPWDYISFQQASHFSGQYNTFASLPELIGYVRSIVGAGPVFMWHMTWAYATDSDHGGFANYGNDQATMYQAIVKCARQAMHDNPMLKILIPVGTAIQDARQWLDAGQNLTRDGYHLELTTGRYIAALTWYSAIFRNIIDASTVYVPEGIDEAVKIRCIDAALLAVAHPFYIN